MADQYPQYPQGGTPNQYPYPQGNPGGQPPYYPAYPQTAPEQYPYPQGRQARAVKNPYATRSLIYGILSIVLVGVMLFTSFIYVGLAGPFAIYYSIRGISISNKLPGNKGLGMAITGLILSILGTLGMIGVFALIALANSGALGQ